MSLLLVTYRDDELGPDHPLRADNRPDEFRLVVDDRSRPHLVSLARAEAGSAG